MHYAYDPSGNLANRLDPNGQSSNTTIFDAFGQLQGQINTATGQPELNPDPVGFSGQWGAATDPETKLVLMTHRYYDPSHGRWLNRDPIGYGGGVNLYGYCGNNPVMHTDRLGHSQDPMPGGGNDVVRLSLAAFIPASTLQFGPLRVHGDGRGFSSNSSHFRLEQNVAINLKTHQVTVYRGQVGQTREDLIRFPYGSAGIGTPPPAGFGWLPMKDTASNRTMHVTSELYSLDDPLVRIHFEGAVSNPLFTWFGVKVAPSISYNFDAYVSSSGSVDVVGSRSEFPAFELWYYRGNQAVPLRTFMPPAGRTPNSLLPFWPDEEF
ncbi:MAG: RHS repeat-associated core domain-containing protein [Armatimonadota bacterium]|nr:RHS repeat-associated core domain-containing protein [Armatimonadota bacterium]